MLPLMGSSGPGERRCFGCAPSKRKGRMITGHTTKASNKRVHNETHGTCSTISSQKNLGRNWKWPAGGYSPTLVITLTQRLRNKIKCGETKTNCDNNQSWVLFSIMLYPRKLGSPSTWSLMQIWTATFCCHTCVKSFAGTTIVM